MERADGTKVKRPFSFGYLFIGLDCGSIVLLVTFLADTPPHRASIIEVFKNAKVPSDTRPSEFDSVMDQKRELLRLKINRTRGPFPGAA